MPVTVTVKDGAIESVEVGDNSETQGIGSNAIEQLPEQFVGLKTAEEVDALDGVSGATITSNALKDAVADCLEQAAAGDAEATDEADEPTPPRPRPARWPTAPTRAPARASAATCP